MNNKLIALKNYFLAHKFVAGIILVALSYGGYKEYVSLTSTAAQTRYVIGEATKQTIITSISGSGQVGTENQIDLKPKVSGDIIFLGVSGSGQEVKSGTLIAQIDTTDAEKAIRDAEINLETAKLSLEKLKQPADELVLTQSENSLARAKTTKQDAEDSLRKANDDGFNTISNTFLDLPGVITGLHDLLFLPSAQLGGTNVNNIDYYSSTANIFDSRGALYGSDTNSKYQSALAKYNKNFADFKALNRTDDPAQIEAVITQTYDTTLAIAEAVKSANGLIQFFQDQMTQNNKSVPTLSNTQLATLSGYTGKINGHLTNLLNIGSTLKTSKNTIINAQRSIDEGTLSLAKLKTGTDPLDIRSSQITVNQRMATLQDAKNALADYYIRAPFDGTIAKLSSKKMDSVSPSTVVATLITKQKIAQISLNEIDAAKIRVGQKVTLTFDAIDELSIAGDVAEVDTVGTVAQGVVTYSVKISFDTQDERVKSGMTVNASIITSAKQNVLAVPASAVKTRGNTSYVLTIPGQTQTSGNQGIISATPPLEQIVTTGVSNDTTSEIVSGITEGAFIVTRTIAPTSAQATVAPSLFGGGGAGRALRN